MTLAEVGLIAIVFVVVSGTTPPDVNEAHYLAKARHYWDPDWCRGDLFLESANAHLVFYWVFGWLTRFLSLETTAWVGRGLTWGLLAWAWQRLSWTLIAAPLWSVLTAACLATFLRWGHMAGEWVLGGVEAKGFAWVLVLVGLRSLVLGAWSRTWLWFGASSMFHALVGGWSVVAGLVAWLLTKEEKPTLRDMLPALVGGGLLALPGLLPLLALSWGVDSATAQAANELYVHQRLPHHLLFSHILSQPIQLDFAYLGWEPWVLPWSHLYLVRHLALVLLGLALWCYVPPDRETYRLALFLAGALSIAGVGMVIDQLTIDVPAVAAQWLRFYWFRLSDVMVPLGAAVALAQAIRKLWANRPALAWGALAVTLLLVAANAADLVARRMVDPRPPAIIQADTVLLGKVEARSRYDEWRRVCEWIRQNTPEQAIVLTPRHQQTFKWFAQRPEVVSWKDVPQDLPGLLEWNRRMAAVFPPEAQWYGLAGHRDAGLKRLAEEYGFEYVLVDRLRRGPRLSFEKVYPTGDDRSRWYEVYRIPSQVEEP